MVDAFLYPALVTADLHIHGRGNKGRLAEADALCSKIADIYRQQAAVGAPLRSLVLAGDILDRGGALPVPMILRLAETFRMFEQVWVIVGNHDTPMRSTAITQLDIFSLCGARIVKEPMVVGSALMLPYYSEVPKDIPDTVRNVFAHKDVRELNGYFDKEWAVSLMDFPMQATVFNGHLHACQLTRHSPHSVYVQMGSPYPCTWSDPYTSNQWLWIVREDSYAPTEALCITGDAGNADSALYAFTRSRDAAGEDDAIIDEKSIIAALAAAEDSRMDIGQALAIGNVDGRVSRIITSIVRHVAGNIEGVKL